MMRFGDGFYGDLDATVRNLEENDIEINLRNFLESYDKNMKSRIQKAAEKSKERIQETMRKETALRLSDVHQQISSQNYY